ncbi:MAG: hypothetical protein QXP71_03205 [Desulfurococcaceae archaeon]
MDLKEKKVFVETVCRNTYIQILYTGLIISVVLGVVSIVFTSVLSSIFKIKGLIYYVVAFSLIFVIVNTIAFIIAKKSIGRMNNLAYRFTDFIEKLSIMLNSDRVELLETTPLPFIAVLKKSKYYIVVKYYDYYTEVNVLDPLNIKRVEGYVPIYLRRSREIMACREIGSVKVCIYRTIVVIAEPGEDAIVEGVFYSRDFRLNVRETDVLIKSVFNILRELMEID